MKKKFLGFVLALMIGVGALAPVPAFAVTCGTANGTTSKLFGLKSWYYYLDCTNGGKDVSSENFKGDKLATSVWTVVLTVLSDMFFLAGFLAIILIVVSGFNFITSAGDPGKATHAKSMLVGTIVGLLITVLAQVIVNTVLGMMNTGGGA
ncbi:hypothetical protein IJG20_01675 [Candidatus Saccharibacteria bacterium]|nr:hypothetical protein [Candidatus Saccharibacteria bacterium]